MVNVMRRINVDVKRQFWNEVYVLVTVEIDTEWQSIVLGTNAYEPRFAIVAAEWVERKVGEFDEEEMADWLESIVSGRLHLDVTVGGNLCLRN